MRFLQSFNVQPHSDFISSVVWVMLSHFMRTLMSNGVVYRVVTVKSATYTSTGDVCGRQLMCTSPILQSQRDTQRHLTRKYKKVNTHHTHTNFLITTGFLYRYIRIIMIVAVLESRLFSQERAETETLYIKVPRPRLGVSRPSRDRDIWGLRPSRD
jgi:hypothetical protein